MTRSRAVLPTVLFAVAMGCGSEPAPHLRITGSVLSASTDAPVANAHVSLWFGSPVAAQRVLRDTTTDISGLFVIETGPPPGYSYPNCSTLHLEVSAAGFQSVPIVGVSSYGSPECQAGVVNVVIRLTPLPE